MHLNHKPGEVMQVDWAGQTAQLIDTDTGGLLKAYIFVAVLPYSGYSYGVNPRIAQEMLGHRDIQTILGIYTSVSRESLQTAGIKISHALVEIQSSEY